MLKDGVFCDIITLIHGQSKGDGTVNRENIALKRSFVIQSFAPLFLLLTIKHLDIKIYVNLIKKFFEALPSKGVAIIEITVNHPSFGSFIVSVVGVCWLLLAIVIALGFKGAQEAGFKSAGEKITIEDSPNDSGATFLVTYVLPLLTDDIESLRGLFVFATMLIMVILLLSRSNTFYQNPVLVAMKYRSFSFKFENPDDDILSPNRLYIGITRGLPLEEDKIIKRKYIADGVFVIFNE